MSIIDNIKCTNCGGCDLSTCYETCLLTTGPNDSQYRRIGIFGGGQNIQSQGMGRFTGTHPVYTSQPWLGNAAAPIVNTTGSGHFFDRSGGSAARESLVYEAYIYIPHECLIDVDEIRFLSLGEQFAQIRISPAGGDLNSPTVVGQVNYLGPPNTRQIGNIIPVDQDEVYGILGYALDRQDNADIRIQYRANAGAWVNLPINWMYANLADAQAATSKIKWCASKGIATNDIDDRRIPVQDLIDNLGAVEIPCYDAGTVTTATTAITTTNGITLSVGDEYVEFPNGTTWAYPDMTCFLPDGSPQSISAGSGALTDGTTYTVTNSQGAGGNTQFGAGGDIRWENSSVVTLNFSNPVNLYLKPTSDASLGNPLVWSHSNTVTPPSTAGGGFTQVQADSSSITYTPGIIDAQIVIVNSGQAWAGLPNSGAPNAQNDWGVVLLSEVTSITVSSRDAEAMNFTAVTLIEKPVCEAIMDNSDLINAMTDLSGTVTNAASPFTTTNGVPLVIGDDYISFPNGTSWASSECPQEMTRAELISLRNASNLDPQCHYIITDPDPNGNLQAEKVLIHAVDSSTLSGCYIKTAHDNTSWVGSYDIDANDVVQVFDHLRINQVKGNDAIIAFPFGNASVTDNVVDHSILTVTGGTVSGNNISGRSNVTVSAGAFTNNTVKTDSNVTSAGNTLRNTFADQSNTTVNSGDFRENNITGDATVISSTTGDVDGNVFKNLCNVTVNGGNLDNSTIGSDANLTINAGNVVNCDFKQLSNTTINGGTFNENEVGQDADVTINSGSNYENIFGASTVFNQVGTGYIRYSTIEGTTSWTNGNTNVSNVQSYVSTINTTGSSGTISNSTFNRALCTNMQNIASLTITDSTLSDYCSITANGAARFYSLRSSFKEGARVLISTGSRIDTSYTEVGSYGYLQSNQDGGFLRVNYSNINSLGYIRNLTPNQHFVDRVNVSSQSNIRFEGTATNCRVYYSKVNSGGAIYLNGTSSNCYVYYCNVNSLGQLYCTNSVNARIYYCNASARSYIRSLNCTSTHYMYYCNASASGYVEQQNNSATVRMYAVSATGQSIARVQNTTVASNLYYSTFDAYYYLLATLTGGTRSALHGYGRRSYTVTNPPNGTFNQNF